MQLVLAGCEYAGKRTLGRQIWEWWGEQTGTPVDPPPHTGFHDHFVVPNVIHSGGHESHKEESEAQILTLNPGLLEHFQRYQIEYHFRRAMVNAPDLWLIDWYYADAVYAPLYYGYGRPGEYGNRRVLARKWDLEVVELMPDLVLVLMKASPEVIRQRMHESPHPKSLLQEQDVPFVLDRFQEEFDRSLIDRRFTLDTTDATVEETFQEFVQRIARYLTPKDRLRIFSHQAEKDMKS